MAAASPGGPKLHQVDNLANEIVDQAMKPGEDSFSEVCGKKGCRDGCMDYQRFNDYCQSVADPQIVGEQVPSFEYKCVQGPNAPYRFQAGNKTDCHEHCTVFTHSSDHCLCAAAYLGVSKSQQEHDDDCLQRATFNKLAKGLDIWVTAAEYVIANRGAELVRDFDEMDSNHDGVISVSEGMKQSAFGTSPLHVCADLDHDGKVTKQEFMESEDMRETGVATCEKFQLKVASQCKQLDSDDDGKISYSEWSGAKKQSLMQRNATRKVRGQDKSGTRVLAEPREVAGVDLAPSCVDENKDGHVSLDECTRLADAHGSMMQAVLCDECSHFKQELPTAKSDTELTAVEAATCLVEGEHPCFSPVMSYATFVCSDRNHDNIVTNEECGKNGAEFDAMPLHVEHGKMSLKQWADDFFEEKKHPKPPQNGASLLQSPAPAPGPSSAPGPAPGPNRPESFMECQRRVTDEGALWSAFGPAGAPGPSPGPSGPGGPGAPGAPGAPGGPGAPAGPGGVVMPTKGEKVPEHLSGLFGDMPNPLDTSGDGRVSWQETYNYAIGMQGADINSVVVDKIFEAVDLDHDKFIDTKEFGMAGAHFFGDGPGKL